MMKTSGAKYARVSLAELLRLVIIGRVLLTFKLGCTRGAIKKSATGGGGAKIQKSIKNFLHLFAHRAHERAPKAMPRLRTTSF